MCQRGSHDVKELIPELFYLSEMFKNENEYELGTMSENGHKVDDVVLPSWAKVNAKRNSTKQKTNSINNILWYNSAAYRKIQFWPRCEA